MGPMCITRIFVTCWNYGAQATSSLPEV